MGTEVPRAPSAGRGPVGPSARKPEAREGEDSENHAAQPGHQPRRDNPRTELLPHGVGDPQECAGQIRKIYGEVGGFGTLLAVTQDPDDHQWEHECLELLKNDVGPRIADLV